MMIFKYTLDRVPRAIETHPIIDVLGLQIQSGIPTFWCLVDEEGEIKKYVIMEYFTGEKLPSDPGTYISTLQYGSLVIHYYLREED